MISAQTHLVIQITVFRTEVGPNLILALGKETQRVEGYLDILRRYIVDKSQNLLAASDAASTSGLRREVQSIMHTPRANLVEELKNKHQRFYDSKCLTQVTNPLVDEQATVNLHQVGANIAAVIDTARSQSLLEHKSKKADHGRVIRDDMRTMLADIKRLR